MTQQALTPMSTGALSAVDPLERWDAAVGRYLETRKGEPIGIGVEDHEPDKRFLELGVSLPDFTISPLLLDPNTGLNIEARERHRGKQYFIDQTSRRRRPIGCAGCMVPNEQGCYIWYSAESFEIAYIGKARFLRNRLQDYWTGRDDKLRGWLDALWAAAEDTPLVAVWVREDARRFERVLINALCPVLNVQH